LIIGVDADGIITPAGLWNPSIRLHWLLFLPLVPFVFSLKPDKKIVEELRNIKKEGGVIVIISARPRQVRWLTEKHFLLHGVPFKKVICVDPGKGTKERKLEAAKKENVAILVDNDNDVVLYFLKKGMKATNSLKEGAKFLKTEAPFCLPNLKNDVNNYIIGV